MDYRKQKLGLIGISVLALLLIGSAYVMGEEAGAEVTAHAQDVAPAITAEYSDNSTDAEGFLDWVKKKYALIEAEVKEYMSEQDRAASSTSDDQGTTPGTMTN